MSDILILWNPETAAVKFEKLFMVDFYKKFNIHQTLICNLNDWKKFIQQSKLESDFIPDFNQSGFSISDLMYLDGLGYIPDTECYSLDCYSVNGSIFASPYQDQIRCGEHVSSAFKKLLAHIELTHNCQIFYN